MVNENATSFLLADRLYVYQLFQLVFGSVPHGDAIDRIYSATTIEALRLYPSVDSGRLNSLLNTWKEYGTKKEYRSVEKLKPEYARLFLGPKTPVAPPWESVYVSGDGLLMQSSTLTVRNAYQSSGFAAAGYPHVADDHLAIELDFMASLAMECVNADSLGDTEGLGRPLQASQAFLAEHLLKWVPKYVSRLVNGEEPGFYVVAAQMLLLFLESDAQVVKELLANTDVAV